MSCAEVVWAVQGFYSELYGWESVTYCDTRADALAMCDCYRENEPGVAFRVRVLALGVTL